MALRSLVLLASCAAAAALSANCTCTQFCTGSCAATNAGKPAKQFIYRLTPYNVTEVSDKDTGTAAGDLGFFMERFKTLYTCNGVTDANTNECFLAFKPVVRRFPVEFDGKFGPYMRCNPLPFYNPTDSQHVDTRNWGCFPWHGYPPTPWLQPVHGSSSCGQSGNQSQNVYCPALMNATVGRDPAQHHAFDPERPNVAMYFGGEWYSTNKLGECGAGRAPGDGKKPHCSWRLQPGQAVKTVNATCMSDNLVPLIRKNGKACFDLLPQPLDPTSRAYFFCLEMGIIGCGPSAPNGACRLNNTATQPTIAPIDKQTMISAWEKAFTSDAVTDGGCPNVP